MLLRHPQFERCGVDLNLFCRTRKRSVQQSGSRKELTKDWYKELGGNYVESSHSTPTLLGDGLKSRRMDMTLKARTGRFQVIMIHYAGWQSSSKPLTLVQEYVAEPLAGWTLMSWNEKSKQVDFGEQAKDTSSVPISSLLYPVKFTHVIFWNKNPVAG